MLSRRAGNRSLTTEKIFFPKELEDDWSTGAEGDGQISHHTYFKCGRNKREDEKSFSMTKYTLHTEMTIKKEKTAEKLERSSDYEFIRFNCRYA